MKWETLIALIRRGAVNANSIVRGPTTHQLWKRAAQIKGLSREFGVCYSCGSRVEKNGALCPACNRLQEPPASPNDLLELRDSNGNGNGAAKVAPVQREIRAAEVALPETRPVAPRAPEVLRDKKPAKQVAPAAPVFSSAPLAEDVSAPAPAALLEPPHDSEQPDGLAASLKRQPASANRPGDALLSAQELATAFQLDFSPTRGQKPAAPPRGRGRGRLVAALLLLAVPLAVMMYIRPDYRRKSIQWMYEKYDAVKSTLTSAESKAPPTPEQTSTAAAAPKSRKTPAPPAPPVAPAAQPAAMLDHAAPKPIETIAKLESTAPPPAEKAAENDSTEATSNDPAEKARVLWRKAIDAEANQDFVEAVNCYEQIKKLPGDVQQEGLDLRLDLAKKQAK